VITAGSLGASARMRLRALLGWLIACGTIALLTGPASASSAQSSGPFVSLEAVSCSGPRMCMALGTLSSGFAGPTGPQPPVPIADRWNGKSWSIEVMPMPPNASPLGLRPTTISCPSSRTCFALLDDRNGLLSVDRWSGGRWSIQLTLQPGRGFSLNDLSCSSPSACTAVGTKNQTGYVSDNVPLVEHWNGRSWSIHRIASPAHGELLNVSCPLRRLCIAVGDTDRGDALSERWNGSRWSRERIPAESYFGGIARGGTSDLSCASATACVAVGGWVAFCGSLRRSGPDFCDPANAQGELMWRWNGFRWSFQARDTDSQWERLSCVSATWCVAVGINASYKSDVQQWNGVRWTTTAVVAHGGLNDVSCTSATNCVAVGTTSAPHSHHSAPFVWQWNGRRWMDRSPPNPSTAPTLR
jgi:hypothetical protein